MIIVHIIDNLTLGGAETLLLSTIKRLPGFNHHVIILDSKIHLKEVEKYAKIHCLQHIGWLSTLKTCKKIKRIIAELKPVVIHAHLFLSSFLARLALGTKYNLVYSIHNLFSATVFNKTHTKWLEKLAYNPRHKLITVSKFVLEDYKKVISNCQEGHVLYNFIDDTFIKNHDFKKKLPPESLNKWVAIGSMKNQKNYLHILKLFNFLYKASNEKEKMSLDIYGDGLLRNQLEEQIRALGLPVQLKGNTKNIASLLNQYDAYISASLYEGYGIAPMEALGIGLPVFLSDIQVYKELYGSFAYFIDLKKDSEHSFFRSIQSYNSLPYIEKQNLLKQSQDYAAEIGDGDAYIKKLLIIYQLNQTV